MITINSNNATAYNNLGNLHAIKGEIDDAITSYKKAISLSSDDSGIYLNLGLAYLMNGNQVESQQMLEHALQQLGNDHQTACNMLGVPTSKAEAKAGQTPILADDIRSLFMRIAGKGDMESFSPRLRAFKMDKGAVYLYWKR